jgi:hypothetical protein
MQTYSAGSLYFLPYVLSREGNQGLHEGTLYDVLDSDGLVPGNATIGTTSFNVTCGFLTVPSVPTTLSFAEADGSYLWRIPSGTGVPTDVQGDSIMIYSTRKWFIRLGFWNIYPTLT